MRIFIGSPPVAYKYIWVVAEADFKHIQKIAFGRSLKHCSAGEQLWNLKLSFWIKCSNLLYLSRQITGSCYWQLGKVIQRILWMVCDQPGGVRVIRAQEQCSFSTSPSLSSSNRAADGQNSRVISFVFSPRAPGLSGHPSPSDSVPSAPHSAHHPQEILGDTGVPPGQQPFPLLCPPTGPIVHTEQCHVFIYFSSPALGGPHICTDGLRVPHFFGKCR